MTGLGLEPDAASPAIVEELAGFRRHDLDRLMTTGRTRQLRFQFHAPASFRCRHDRSCSILPGCAKRAPSRLQANLKLRRKMFAGGAVIGLGDRAEQPVAARNDGRCYGLREDGTVPVICTPTMGTALF